MTDKPKQIYLNVGNLWEDRFLDKVIELNELHANDGIRISSLFGSIANYTPTARSFDRLPVVHDDDVPRYIERAERHGISIRYTLNASCIGSIQEFRTNWNNTLEDRVKKLSDLGVHEWTITSPLVFSLMYGLVPEHLLEVSTIAEISNVHDMVHWHELGARAVNLSTSINRDAESLMSIMHYAQEKYIDVTLLANEACLYRCPFRRECYNLSSHDSSRGPNFFDNYPFRNCNNIRLANPEEWIKSRMILPQWMAKYNEVFGISQFKIAFRTHPYEVAVPILELYMNQYHGGNYLDLWPTIRHLGNTEEPKDSLYLSCKGLDEIDMMKSIGFGGYSNCHQMHCGVDCMSCFSVANDPRVLNRKD